MMSKIKTVLAVVGISLIATIVCSTRSLIIGAGDPESCVGKYEPNRYIIGTMHVKTAYRVPASRRTSPPESMKLLQDYNNWKNMTINI